MQSLPSTLIGRHRGWTRGAAALMLLLLGTTLAAGSELAGRWEGEWHSISEKFHGVVNAKITQCDATHYKAVFWGRAFKIMPFRYTAILTACCDLESGEVHFSCTQKLPIWGCYWMHGSADGCEFFARYHTDENYGYFKMHRVSSD